LEGKRAGQKNIFGAKRSDEKVILGNNIDKKITLKVIMNFKKSELCFF
jgi:hypothetical protein